MNRFKFLFFIIFLGLGIPFSFAQTDTIPLKTLIERKNKLAQDYPVEKVYLHFDKPYYAVGDTIWFKAYVTAGLHYPSPLSKIVYVEMMNSRDSLVASLKLPVENSVATGAIILNYPDYKEDTYHIRAYTKWMLNSNESYFFKKNIYVGNIIGKNLSTNIHFKGEVTDKALKVNSQINFKDDKGVPFSGKKVSWEVIADDERIARGKETTDAKGNVNIAFSSSPKVALSRGKLFTELENDDHRIFKSTFPLKTALLENDIQFFPEGGELIAGIINKVAFKAISSDGLGVAVKGIVTDETGKEIANVNSQHLGMGEFSFIPEQNKKYQAKVTFSDNTQKTFILPEAKSEGLNIAMTKSGEDLILKISVNTAYLNKNLNQGFYIVAQNGGTIYYAAQSTLTSPVFTAKIPQSKFPTGIIQFTLLKANGTPISERLIFVQRKDDLKINVKTDQPSYSDRQKTKMSISTSEGMGPSRGTFSVAVVDESKVPVNEDTETTIKSELLLTSDLEGYIEQPNYYFNKPDDKKEADLDVLMLTQGYRRFLFKDVVANTPPKISFLPEQGIDISGTIRKSNGMPLEDGRILFQIPDKHFSTTGTTDKEGKFRFNKLVFRDSSDVVINARNNINSNDLRITVDGEPYPSVYANENAPDEMLNFDDELHTYLENSKLEHNNAFMLNEVVVKSQAVKKPSHADYTSLTGLNMDADHTTSGDQLNGCTVILNCLSGAGLTYEDQNLYITRTYNQGIKVPVEIYVNDMPVDINYLASLNASGIESVEVFNNDGLSGINRRTNTSGVVVINLKEIKKVPMSKDQFKSLFPPNNVLTYKPKGYAVERKFYSPKYTGPRTSLQSKDLRSTIYWNPLVNTTDEGTASFEYFNGDEKGTYRVVIEGMDDNGDIGRTVYRYQIK